MGKMEFYLKIIMKIVLEKILIFYKLDQKSKLKYTLNAKKFVKNLVFFPIIKS